MHGSMKPAMREHPASRRARRLATFSTSYRRYIAGLTSCSPALEDLADSFPALLFALASGYGTVTRREACCQTITDGGSLRLAAERLDLPLWLRRLPANAFSGPLGRLPGDANFSHKISSLMPVDPRQAPGWLARLQCACDCCGPEFAIWAARQRRLPFRIDLPDGFLLLAAWAWFAGQPGTSGHRVLRRPWHPEIGLGRSIDEMLVWHRRIALAERLGNTPGGVWLCEGHALGYDFVALNSVDDFIAEGARMGNCLDQCAEYMSCWSSRVFSIRRGGQHIADVEIVARRGADAMPAIEQLKGPRNRSVSPEVWQATFAWLGSQTLKPFAGSSALQTSKRRASHRVLKEIWAPYLRKVRGTAHEDGIRRLALLTGQGRRQNSNAGLLEELGTRTIRQR